MVRPFSARMNTGIGCLALAGLLGGCPERQVQRPRPPRKLLILTLNDLHGQLDPDSYRTLETPPRTVRVGGAQALTATIREMRRRRGGRVLLLDAGDFMQGSVLSNSFEGAPVRELFARLGVDAAAIGNHEFDFGPVGPQTIGGADPLGALKAWALAAPFPVLSANLADQRGAPLLAPNIRPVALVRRAGVRVGIIGLTTVDTPGTTHPDNIRQLRFLPYLPQVRRWSRVLRRRGAEAIVLLAHVGGSCRGRAPRTCRGDVVRLVRALPRGTVDAAVAGHSHRCMWHEINGVPVVQACSRGKALGRIELTIGPGGVRARALAPLLVCHDVFSDSGGCEARLRVGPRRGHVVPSPLLARHAGEVQAVTQMLARYRRRLRPRPETVIARAARPLPHTRSSLSPMGLLLAEVLRRAVPGAEVALVNAGGVRAGLRAGPITYRDLYRVFPFDNQLAYAEVTGRELEQLVSSYLGREHAGFLLVSGLRYRVRCGRPLQLVRITDLQGRPLADDRRYRVALSDFLLAGGVGFGRVLSSVPAARKRILRGRLIRDALIAYLKRLGHELNDEAHPVIPPGAPLIVVENGPCERRARRRSPRHICR